MSVYCIFFFSLLQCDQDNGWKCASVCGLQWTCLCWKRLCLFLCVCKCCVRWPIKWNKIKWPDENATDQLWILNKENENKKNCIRKFFAAQIEILCVSEDTWTCSDYNWCNFIDIELANWSKWIVELKLSEYRFCQRISSRRVIFLNKKVYLLLFSSERMKSIQSKVQSSSWHRPFLASDATFLFVWNQPVDLFYTWSWTIPIKTCSILLYSIRVADSASVFFYSSEMPTHLQLDAHL